MKEKLTSLLAKMAPYKIPILCGVLVVVLGVTAVIAVPIAMNAGTDGTQAVAGANTDPTEDTQVENIQESPRQLADFNLAEPMKVINPTTVHSVGVIGATEAPTEAEEPVEVEHKVIEKEKLPEVDKAPVNDAADPGDGADDAGNAADVDISDIAKGDYESQGMSLGIDVSHHQGSINWQQVKDSGIEFAMIRVGYRSRDTGTIYEDRQAAANMKGALAAGLKVGVYFFSQAINEYEAVEEASWVVNYVSKYQITYPIVYDCEYIGQYRTAAAGVTKSQRTDYAIAFMETVKSAGYSPMMYASKNGYANNWETDRLSNRYKIWVAQYPGSVNPVTDKSSYTGKHQMWQYTSKGSVPGISGNVDMNVAYFKYTGTPDASVTNVKFVVKDNSGKAVKGATVQMAGATTNSAITDETGTAVFTYVPFGDYTVTVSGVPNGYKKTGKIVQVNFSKYQAEYVDSTSFVLEPGQDDSTTFPVGDETFTRVNKQVKVTASTLNVREFNNTSSRVLGKVTKNTVLKCTATGSGSWIQVEYNGQTGYVSRDYVTFVDESSSCVNGHTKDTPTYTKVDDKTHKVTYICKVCKEEIKDAAVTENHTWDDGKVTTAAICGKDGVKTYTCTKCGATKTEVIPAPGKTHKWEKRSDGTYKCTVCGEVKEDVTDSSTETETESTEESSSETESSTAPTQSTEPSSTEPVTEAPTESSTPAESTTSNVSGNSL